VVEEVVTNPPVAPEEYKLGVEEEGYIDEAVDPNGCMPTIGAGPIIIVDVVEVKLFCEGKVYEDRDDELEEEVVAEPYKDVPTNGFGPNENEGVTIGAVVLVGIGAFI